MSRHRTQRLKAIATCQQEFGPDRTTAIYEFKDGWQIRQIPDDDEAQREGKLMHLCMRDSAIAGLMFSLATIPRVGGLLLSLRDPDGYPHLTFVHDPMTQLTSMAESNGATEPKPKYRYRVDRWHKSLPYPARWMVGEGEQTLSSLADEMVESFEWLAGVAERGELHTLPAMKIDAAGRLDGRHRLKVGRIRWR